MDVFWSWPPVTRTLVAGSLITSVLAYSGLVPYYPLPFIPSKVLAVPPQLWRLVTSFLLTGQGLGIIFDPYFLYMYGSQLELGSPRFTGHGDFFTYIIFNGLVIILKRFLEPGKIAPALRTHHHSHNSKAGYILGGALFLSPLIMAIMYTFAQDNPERSVTFFVINVPAKYLPYLMLLVTFVMAGPAPTMHQGAGILSSHLYDFLTRIWPTFGGGRNVIFTPRFVKEWFGGGGVRPEAQKRGYGMAQAPAGEARSTGTSWSNQRGPGRRLGGE
ncbi:uncharacterized protein K452DRAFT_358026 [Aplosporella prunicola CBS 121167]|uniref:Derlin n=1 Tax=Aplosporella prunicola CBS 121167 TaxID=1176127 RepID=A0A6A6BIA3_9PEZI|nr:uncharacterized protein K452DRAFT_358026 [Aplosporella prunicola CBS 121167]KAF2142984.1 hypothetical protein K452DRAFT_358026 [Aplosporella prunicola CBS 121167]